LKLKTRQIGTTVVLSIALAMFSVNGSANAASPSLKAQLQTLMKKTTSTWTKIGSFGVQSTNSLYTEFLYYNDQIEVRSQMIGQDRKPYWQTEVFEPLYSYTPFQANLASSQITLDKAGMLRADWVRYTGGYSGNAFSDWMFFRNPNNFYMRDVTHYEKLSSLPLNVVKDAITNSKSISQNKKSKQWIISGTCQVQILNIPEGFTNANRDITTITVTRNCTTYVDFYANGAFKALQQDTTKGESDTFVFNTPKPTTPFVDHAYVIDKETGTLAEYK
jgi:hypothetical protein